MREQPEDKNKLTQLPEYLKYDKRNDELLNHLTHEHFAKLLIQTETISPLINQIDMGLSASQLMNRNLSLFNYSMLKSLSLELADTGTSKTEVEARLATGDIEQAISLANGAILKEDRLHLLSIIAKSMHQRGQTIGENLRAQIHLLAGQIDFTELGKKAASLASDLVWTDPDLAIEILEKATEKRADEDADIEFARLSMVTQLSNSPNTATDHLLEKAVSKIHDQEIQDFLSRARVYFGKCTAEEAIQRVKDSEFKTKLFCLRNWAKFSSERKDAGKLLNFALDEIIKNTGYIPQIRVLCDIAIPLPNIIDPNEARSLVARFDSIIASIQQFSSSQDNTKLQLLIGQTESHYDEVAMSNRMVMLYYDVAKITDLSVRIECLAMIKAALPKLDPKRNLERKEQLHSLIDVEFQDNVGRLLRESAAHFDLLKGTIDVLAIEEPETVIRVIQTLNTHYNRNAGYLELSKIMLLRPINKIHFSLLRQIIKDYANKETGRKIINDIFVKALQEKENIEPSQLIEVESFVELIGNIESAYLTCITSSAAYSLFSYCDKVKFMHTCEHLRTLINKSFDEIEPTWIKIEAGNRVALNIAPLNDPMAKEYLLKTRGITNQETLEAEKSINSYLLVLKLAIRSYCGLVINEENTEDQFNSIEYLIGLIPSIGEQISLWSDMALICYSFGKKEFLNKVVLKYILPGLDKFPKQEKDYKQKVIELIAPSLYYHHTTTAIEMINSLDIEHRDKALYQICDYIFTKTEPMEPYEKKARHGFKITYAEALDICVIIEQMKTDYYLYSVIEILVDGMISKASKFAINDIQKNSIKDKLKALIQTKFPDPENIKHEGFKVISKAQVMRLEKTNRNDWMVIIDRAVAIPNVSDRAYVLPIIASCIPSSLEDLRNYCIEKSVNETQAIPTDIDRIDRYIHIAEQVQYIAEPWSRTALKKAMETSAMSEDPEMVYPKQRRIVDIANRISPEFADEVANLFDCDPARMKARIDSLTEDIDKIHARFDLHGYLEMLQVRNDIVKKRDKTKAAGNEKKHYPQVAWSTLAALNADIISPVSLQETSEYLGIAAELPLTEAYPIYLWAIVNVTKRLQGTPKSMGTISPIFQSLVALSNFTLQVHSRTKAQLIRIQKSNISLANGIESIIIDVSDREKVIQFLRKWMSEELGDYLYMCDPYFTKEDLEYVKLVNSINKLCNIVIVTNEKSQGPVLTRIDLDYRAKWREISEEEAPKTEVIIASINKTGQPPIHDRFWVTNGSGLNFGTSLNAIGSPRISHISVMQIEEYEKWSQQILPFINKRKECKGLSIDYFSFSL